MAVSTPDGGILPSFLGVRSDAGHSPGAGGTLQDAQLRVGEVIQAFPPDHAENVSKMQWEYIVQVMAHRDDHGSFTEAPQLYHAVLGDMFGSLADRRRFSLRPASTAPDLTRSVSNGSMVLLLCPNGDKSQAVIIGAWRQPLEAEGSAADHAKFRDPVTPFFDFEFMGVHATIDKDGAMKLQVPGATKLDGSPAPRDSNNHGTQVTFAKDGSVLVEDQNGQSIRISPGLKHVEIRGKAVQVFSDDIDLGDDTLTKEENGVVFGGGIDTFTGLTYFELQNASKHVKVKK